MSDDLLGEQIQICHKTGKITGTNRSSVTVTIELGGIHQDILVAKDVAEEQLEGDR